MRSLAQMKIFPKEAHGYKQLEHIGAGSYSDIWKVEKDGEYYAMKAVKLKGLQPSTLKHLKTELTILKMTDCFCIIKLVEAFETENLLILILELCGEDFKKRIFDKQDKKQVFRNDLTETDILVYFRQIAIGVQYLHEKHIIHRDLKYENILICDDLIKLSDFGLSAITLNDEILRDFVGSPFYVSPEMIKMTGYSYKTDIWSLGVLLYNMLHKGKMPFDTNKDEVNLDVGNGMVRGEALQQSLYRAILYKDFVVDSSLGLTDSTVDLLENLLEKDPDLRFNIHQVLSHPSLNGGNYYYLETTFGGESKEVHDGYTFYATDKPSKNEEFISFTIIGDRLQKGTVIFGAYFEYYEDQPKVVPFRLEEKARENVLEEIDDTEIVSAYVVRIIIS